MRRVLPVLLGLSLVLVVVPGGTAEPPRKRDELMKRKLEQAQKVLEGIAVEDHKKVETAAEELIEISKQAEWRVYKTAEYDRHSNDFRRSAEGLAEAARKKNTDAQALQYVDLTLSCVKCHKHVRDTRMTHLD